jgi:hypothetical protein
MIKSGLLGAACNMIDGHDDATGVPLQRKGESARARTRNGRYSVEKGDERTEKVQEVMLRAYLDI